MRAREMSFVKLSLVYVCPSRTNRGLSRPRVRIFDLLRIVIRTARFFFHEKNFGKNVVYSIPYVRAAVTKTPCFWQKRGFNTSLN